MVLFFLNFQTMNETYEKRVRRLLSQLKKMARELPSDIQQRVPYELLAELATSLALVLLLSLEKKTDAQMTRQSHHE